MTGLSVADQRAYEANIWKAYLLQFLHSFQLGWPIWVIYLTDFRGFSLTQVSGLEALFWVVIILGEVPTGAVADRFGRKTSLILGAGWTTAAVLVFGLADSYLVVLVSYVAWGLGLTFQSGADSALVFESLKAVGRERDYPRVAGMGWGVFSLGALAGMLAGAPLAAATNLAFPVLISAAIAFLALLVALTLREPDLPEGEARLGYRHLVRESARTAWRAPSVRSMLLLSALIIAATNAAGIFAQPFLNQHDVPVHLFGVAQAPMRVAGIVGAVAAYRIVSITGTRPAFILAPLIMAGSYVVLGGWMSVFAFGALVPILFINSMVLPLSADYLNRRIPNNQRATILSFRQLLSSVAIAALQPSLGVIADQVSLEAVFWTAAAFIGVTTPLAVVWWLTADTRERAPPPIEAQATSGAGPGP
jgi:predicted MFS family arabinose efflux permease